MDSCCDDKASELAQLHVRQGRVLHIVLAINAVMFVLEFSAGWILASTALLGDSLDMLGDAMVYTVSLYVLHRGVRARAGAALFKSGSLMLFSVLIIAEAIRKSLTGVVPEADGMALIALVALAANLTCFGLLYRHRSDDINMSSTWICSRNDVIANISVLVAAALVMLTGTLWPDVIVGASLALLYLHSSWWVAREAWPQWRAQGVSGMANPPLPRDVPTSTSSTGCCGTDARGQGDGGGVVAPPLPRAEFSGASPRQGRDDPTDAVATGKCCNDKPMQVESKGQASCVTSQP